MLIILTGSARLNKTSWLLAHKLEFFTLMLLQDLYCSNLSLRLFRKEIFLALSLYQEIIMMFQEQIVHIDRPLRFEMEV